MDSNYSKPKHETVNGQDVRTSWYLPGFLKVGDNGSYLKKRNKMHVDYDVKVHKDEFGHRYVYNQRDRIYVDSVVMGAFGVPMPNDGKGYVIGHKDGDMDNDSIGNLAWMTRDQAYPYKPASTSPSVKIGDGVTVGISGKISRYGKELDTHTCVGDPDLGLIVPVVPYVEYDVKNHWGNYSRVHKHYDDLMDEAGYVAGNKQRHRDPVVLHKDNDYRNFTSDNLEWTDRSDPRYRDYHNKRADDMFEYGMELNNGNYPDFLKAQKI